DYGNNVTVAAPPHLFGGWSQYLYVVPGSFLVRVPDALPTEVAVLTEVMAVTVGLDRAKQFSAVPNEPFLFDDTVVVLGVGPLGMCFLMKARILGAGTIVAVDPHRHLCSKNVRILGVGGEEVASYGPSMRQLLRYMRHYPVREFVSHRCRLDDVDAAVKQSIASDSMKVVIDPWA